MRIIHGILLFGVVCLITIKTKKLNVLKYHWSLIEEPNRTIHNTGEKTIRIRTTGNEKNRVIVVSACAGDASKLRPMVIFKRKTLPKVANKHGVVIAAQEKGWMDTEGMKLWIDKRCVYIYPEN